MNDKKVLSKAADTLTAKPIPIDIKRTNFTWYEKILMKFKRLKPTLHFEIRPVSVANMYRIAGKVIQFPESFNIESNVQNTFITILNEQYDNILYIIAVGLQNNKYEPSKKLMKIIGDEFDSKQIFFVFNIIIKQFDVQDFMKSIILIRGANVLSAKAKDAEPVTTQD